MECLYKEDVDRIFTLDEPFEEMGSEAIEVPALKEEEFAQIVVLGLCVFFPNGDALSFVLYRRHENVPLRGGSAMLTVLLAVFGNLADCCTLGNGYPRKGQKSKPK
ncbi:hypothetical protein Tco_0603215 [Tanacetum coccineum]